MMRTKAIIHAKLKARMPEGSPIPPFTAVETLICEAIDEMRHASRSFIREGELAYFEERIG